MPKKTPRSAKARKKAEKRHRRKRGLAPAPSPEHFTQIAAYAEAQRVIAHVGTMSPTPEGLSSAPSVWSWLRDLAGGDDGESKLVAEILYEAAKDLSVEDQVSVLTPVAALLGSPPASLQGLREAEKDAGFPAALKLDWSSSRATAYVVTAGGPLSVEKFAARHGDQNLEAVGVSRAGQLILSPPGQTTYAEHVLNHEDTVRSYMVILNFLQDGEASQHGRERGREAAEFARLTWARLRSAELIDVLPSTFDVLQRQAFQDRFGHLLEDREVMAHIASGAEDAHPKVTSALQSTQEECIGQPFIPHLPFEHVFIGMGEGLPIRPQEVEASFPPHFVEKYEDFALLGFLVGRNNIAVRLSRCFCPETSESVIFTDPIYDAAGRKWRAGLASVEVLALLGLCRFIDQRSARRATSPDERTWSREASRLGPSLKKPVPKPYYMLPLERLFVERQAREVLPDMPRRMEFSHQFMREAHFRRHVRRGPLPLDPQTARDLRDRWSRCKGDVVIYTDRDLPADLAEELVSKGHKPRRPGEWVAVLSTRIAEQKVPKEAPPGMPFIPAVRSQRRPFQKK